MQAVTLGSMTVRFQLAAQNLSRVLLGDKVWWSHRFRHRCETVRWQQKNVGALLRACSWAYLLDSSMAAPPTLNKQLGMSMERSLPKYQFWVMFSVLTTRARLLGYTCITNPVTQGAILH